MSKIGTKKEVFLMKNLSIQPLWLTYFIEILLVLDFQLTKFIVGTFSYKAHFRSQISSNGAWMGQKEIRVPSDTNIIVHYSLVSELRVVVLGLDGPSE